MQKAKLELIKQWIIKADHDLGTSEITLKHILECKDNISIHCQ